jgi:hypothetical protein
MGKVSKDIFSIFSSRLLSLRIRRRNSFEAIGFVHVVMSRDEETAFIGFVRRKPDRGLLP